MAEFRKYNRATTILFPLIDAGAQDFEATPVTFVSADTQIIIDEAVAATAANTPAHEGNGIYSLALVTAETSGARIIVTVIDQTATKTWEDQAIIIETYGDPKAQHAFDLDTPAITTANVSAIVDDALTNFGTSTLATAGVSAIVQLALGNFGVSTLATAGLSAVVDDALSNFGVSTLDAATVSAAVDDALTNFGVSTLATAGISATMDNVLAAFGVSVLTSAAVSVIAKNSIWDEPLTGSSHNDPTSAGRRLRTLQDFGVYEGGAVWIDTVNGTAGTTDFENGTVTNPVNTIADARTIADSVGLRVFHVLPASSITLAAAFNDFEFIGFDYTMAFGGQSVDKTMVRGSSSVTGTFSGNPRLEFCSIGAITGPSADLHACGLTGTITVNGVGDWFIHHSFSKVAGTGTPVFDFGAAILNTNLSMRSWSGGIEIQNIGGAGTDNASIEGFGQVVLNANCAGGTIAIRGNLTVTDNAGGAVTLSDDARIDVGQVSATVDDALVNLGVSTLATAGVSAVVDDAINNLFTFVSGGVNSNVQSVAGNTSAANNLGASAGVIVRGTVDTTGFTPTTTEFEADDITEATADHFNGRVIIFTSGALKDQATDITDYSLVGGRGHFTTTALTEAPANNVTFVIV